uniref:ACB domain-containing protein n=1 Tax=Angiostrongylus cantonensis TaxID=6313 RepID=A0A0K0CTT1_ANGCA
MEQLRKAAIRVLEEAKRDEELHNVACNMQKYPGHEWGKSEKAEEYVASYRLESDRSWTPVADIVERDQQFASLKTFMKQQIL